METFLLLMNGIGTALVPLNLALLIFGCLIGLFVGAMPGLGSVNGVAILIPITFIVPPTAAIIFLPLIFPPGFHHFYLFIDQFSKLK